MAALRFRSPDRRLLSELREQDWPQTLDFCDRTQLTLPLGLTCRGDLPETVCARIQQNLTNNAQRWTQFKSAYQDLASAFETDGLECVVLKGFSHCPLFVRDPRHRLQVDLDLLLAEGQIYAAYDRALGLGYEPIDANDTHPINHLPTLVRKTGWQWRGDHFDVDLPVSIELHFQLWDADTERFDADGLEEFWERRQRVQLEGLSFTALDDRDAVANASLHLLRHLLRGKLRPYHVYEIAWMLHHSAADEEFWSAWSAQHPQSLRGLQAICFALAHDWFDCQLPEAASEEIERFPHEIRRWLEIHSDSPLAGRFHPNKDELWLHWNLLENTRDRLSVIQRRLFPHSLPGPVGTVHVPKERLQGLAGLQAKWKYLSFLGSRAAHHLRTLPTTAWSALRWFSGSTGLGKAYWRFFFAEGFFNFGMFVFVFLYNLYLLQLGYREDFLGVLASVMTASSVAGSLLAVGAMRKFGIRRSLMVSFVLIAAISALRAFIADPTALLVLAGAGGLVSSSWAIAFSPAITQVTNERNRPLGFSIFCSAGIAIGIAGGLAAGRLPGWLLKGHLASSTVESYRFALFAGCAFVLLALVPLSLVQFGATPPPERKLHRPSPMVRRFLIAIGVWSLGTGALAPFFNVFFARQIHLSVQSIGYVFASAQVAQVCGMMLAPILFRRLGLTRAIAGMQFAAAIMMAMLSVAAGPLVAGAVYALYMMFQFMSEPGMFTMLMEGATPGDRGGASALNFLVSFGVRAVAAAVSGWLLAHLGYPPVMVISAVICVAAALLFHALLSNPKLSAASNQ